ncbi:MAG TPA: GPW/gp25 family protein [Pyrinomonadaceae bacterium]|jgi:phage baseplate assembly protein W
MTLQGSWLSHPFRADQRGMLATSADRAGMIEQSIRSILETRQGERVMVPDYGIPDFVFAVMGPGFVPRLGYFLEQQLRRYEPLIDSVRVRAGTAVEDVFTPGFAAEQQKAAIQIEYTERGSNTPRNLVYPTWRFRQ